MNAAFRHQSSQPFDAVNNLDLPNPTCSGSTHAMFVPGTIIPLPFQLQCTVTETYAAVDPMGVCTTCVPRGTTLNRSPAGNLRCINVNISATTIEPRSSQWRCQCHLPMAMRTGNQLNNHRIVAVTGALEQPFFGEYAATHKSGMPTKLLRG